MFPPGGGQRAVVLREQAAHHDGRVDVRDGVVRRLRRRLQGSDRALKAVEKCHISCNVVSVEVCFDMYCNYFFVLLPFKLLFQ